MRAFLGLLYGLVVLLGAVLSGLVVGTIGVLPFVVLPRGRRFPWTMPAVQLFARSVLAMLFVRLEIEGEWPLEEGQGALIFCNHRSWLDPVALMAVTRSHGLSKSQILWIPFIGFYGWLSGGVFFNRKDKAQRKRAREEVIDLVAHGHRLQVFPEGTRNLGEGTREKVYLVLAMDAFVRGLPVVPCAIRRSEAVLPPGKPAAYPGQVVKLWIGKPLDASQYSTGHAYAQATWDEVRAAYERLG